MHAVWPWVDLDLYRDADETITWIQEKDVLLSTEDFGRDLASVQALQRKHDGVERDLAALDDKVRALSSEADRLTETHPEMDGDIRNKQQEIVGNWETLKTKVRDMMDFLLGPWEI